MISGKYEKNLLIWLNWIGKTLFMVVFCFWNKYQINLFPKHFLSFLNLFLITWHFFSCLVVLTFATHILLSFLVHNGNFNKLIISHVFYSICCFPSHIIYVCDCTWSYFKITILLINTCFLCFMFSFIVLFVILLQSFH